MRDARNRSYTASRRFLIARFSLLLMAGAALSCFEHDAPVRGERLDLSGAHAFRSGDDPAFADPSLDDSGWARATVPGSWSSQGIRPPDGVGWYRFHFTVPEELEGQPLAAFLGRIGSADETFLNGVKIGGHGRFGPWGVGCAMLERVYELPAEALRSRGDNVLAVRVLELPNHGGGFLQGAPHIGSRDEVTREAGLRHASTVTAEAIILGLFGLAWVIVGVLAWSKRGEFAHLWVFVTAYIVVYAVERNATYALGLKTAAVQRLSFALQALLPALVLSFLLSFAAVRRRRLLAAAWISSVLLAVAAVLPLSPAWSSVARAGWVILVLGTGAIGAGELQRARRGGDPNAGPVLLGMTVFGLGTAVWMLGPPEWTNLAGIPVVDLSMLLFVIIVEAALARRLVRAERQLIAASATVLQAHEAERGRLARELHDGVAQSLASLKLEFQSAAAQTPSDAESRRLGGAVERVQGVIDELRGVAMDLHPPTALPLEKAIRLYASALGSRLGLVINVAADPEVDPGPDAANHLFRIFQEATSNACRHGGARTICVELERTPRNIRLAVIDDGRGLVRDDDGVGLGLRTMRERAKILGGALRVESRPDEGTRVEVEVPL